MSILRRGQEDVVELAANQERQRQKQRAKEEVGREKQFRRAWDAFWASPAGQARQAFEQGDHVFQFNLDVVNQSAWSGGLIGTRATRRQADPTAILNSVCVEGWELVNGDFVFLMQGSQSRDFFLSSGQNTAVRGTVMGYYLFRRCEENRQADTERDLRRRLWEAIIPAED